MCLPSITECAAIKSSIPRGLQASRSVVASPIGRDLKRLIVLAAPPCPANQESFSYSRAGCGGGLWRALASASHATGPRWGCEFLSESTVGVRTGYATPGLATGPAHRPAQASESDRATQWKLHPQHQPGNTAKPGGRRTVLSVVLLVFPGWAFPLRCWGPWGPGQGLARSLPPFWEWAR